MPKQSKDQILFDVHNHNINLNSREIYLHSFYTKDEDEEPGVDYRQATTFIKNLMMLDLPTRKNQEDVYLNILVHMHSIGGCWDNGMAMFNSIESAQSYVRILSYSQASSMSGVIFQAADERIMMPDCHFLMHHGDVGLISGHPFSAKVTADFTIKACKRMLEIFASKAINGPYFSRRKSATIETAYNYFDKKLKEKVDWYLSADEAVHYGLADGILGSKEYPNVHSLRN